MKYQNNTHAHLENTVGRGKIKGLERGEESKGIAIKLSEKEVRRVIEINERFKEKMEERFEKEKFWKEELEIFPLLEKSPYLFSLYEYFSKKGKEGRNALGFYVKIIEEERKRNKNKGVMDFYYYPFVVWSGICSSLGLNNEEIIKSTSLIGGWGVFTYMVSAFGEKAINWRGSHDVDLVIRREWLDSFFNEVKVFLDRERIEFEIAKSQSIGEKLSLNILAGITEKRRMDIDVYPYNVNEGIKVGETRFNVEEVGEKEEKEKIFRIYGNFPVGLGIASPLTLIALKVHSGRIRDVMDVLQVLNAFEKILEEKEWVESLKDVLRKVVVFAQENFKENLRKVEEEVKKGEGEFFGRLMKFYENEKKVRENIRFLTTS